MKQGSVKRKFKNINGPRRERALQKRTASASSEQKVACEGPGPEKVGGLRSQIIPEGESDQV
jgi:hypothetical protein